LIGGECPPGDLIGWSCCGAGCVLPGGPIGRSEENQVKVIIGPNPRRLNCRAGRPSSPPSAVSRSCRYCRLSTFPRKRACRRLRKPGGLSRLEGSRARFHLGSVLFVAKEDLVGQNFAPHEGDPFLREIGEPADGCGGYQAWECVVKCSYDWFCVVGLVFAGSGSMGRRSRWNRADRVLRQGMWVMGSPLPAHKGW
jgi:hypothetical protein